MDAILSGNPYFSAGAGLIAITASLAAVRLGAGHALTIAKRRLLVSLEIPSKDQSYHWFLEWMANQNMIQPVKKSILDRLISRKHHQLSVETSFERHANGSTATRFSLVPGPGQHFFKYKDAWFQVC